MTLRYPDDYTGAFFSSRVVTPDGATAGMAGVQTLYTGYDPMPALARSGDLSAMVLSPSTGIVESLQDATRTAIGYTGLALLGVVLIGVGAYVLVQG